MKTRHGFVSNSSSSSFICEVCGEILTVYDGCFSESSLIECENGHTFCNDHKTLPTIVNRNTIATRMLDYLVKQQDEDIASIIKGIEEGNPILAYEDQIQSIYNLYDGRLFLKEQCPICSLDSITDDTLIKFIEYKYKIKREVFEKEIRDSFSDLEACLEAVKVR